MVPAIPLVYSNLQGVFLFWPPPNWTKSQAHYEFLYLGNFREGQFNLQRAWDLVKLGGARIKKTPCSSNDGGVNQFQRFFGISS